MKKMFLKGALTVALGSGLIFVGSDLAAKVPEKSRFEKLEIFNKVLFLIESQYYRKVDTEKLINGALKGMMSTLDPHSAFLDKEVFSKMQEDTKGEFGGLGIEVTLKDGILVITTPIEDTPAFRAGLKAGDKIVEINHESTIGITLEEAVSKMRGKADSKIILGIAREGVDGIKSYEINREIIKIRSVKSSIVNENYAYVRLTQFQKNAGKDIVTHIKKMRKQAKIKGIILDLRSNPGGLLDEAVNVSSIFLKDGVVVSTEGRDPKNKDIRYVKKQGHKELDTPLVVLINGSSASASEIVAGALQDHSRAIIMGTQSFGKGSVQTVSKIGEEVGVKLTIAQYMTPKSRKIQALGITPDVKIPEAEGEWLEENLSEGSYIREADLKNHLSATIETKEEKKRRLAREKEERLERIKRIKEMREKKKNKSKDDRKKYDPKSDYQVQQAVNYIKSFSVFKRMSK
ncbi:S41 family peptidase [Halobacteriovorax sp. GB3]|uniref:S41 family peptidase n=1 Tax=Halobacteriovorax sp. GB3 TaxID=2719615 RepID=UPI00236063F4|nr:S41 family peptidase [Halobacteriovorax sp. GB3]MDD0853879.1 S41 family peptidase [Halobacteriovorax sp. GB3]